MMAVRIVQPYLKLNINFTRTITTMDHRKLIFIAIIIVLIFGMPDVDSELIKQCRKQLKSSRFNMSWNSTVAFKHAFKKLTVPNERPDLDKRGMLYAYMDHLYAAGTLYVFKVTEPVEWCCENSGKYHIIDDDNKKNNCKTIMNVSKLIADVSDVGLFYSHVFYSRKNKLPEIERTRIHSKYACVDYIIYMESTLTKCIEKTTALGPYDFCNVVQNPPKPELRKTKQGSTSNPQPNIDNKQTIGHHDFDLNEAANDE